MTALHDRVAGRWERCRGETCATGGGFLTGSLAALLAVIAAGPLQAQSRPSAGRGGYEYIDSVSLDLVVDVNRDLSAYRAEATFRFRARDAGAELRFLYNGIDSVAELEAIELDGRSVDRSLVQHLPDEGAFVIDGRRVALTPGAHTLRVVGPTIYRQPDDIVRFGNWHPHWNDWDEAMPVRMEVRTPAHVAAVGSGRLVSDSVMGDRRTTRWQSIGPTFWMLLTVAPYRVDRVRRGARELLIYRQDDLAGIDAEPAGDVFFQVLEFLETQIGPLQRDTFGLLVRSGLPNAMMDGVMTMSMDYYAQVRQQPDNLRPLFGHELSHLWWGGLVKARGPGALWLIESFAEYWRTLYEAASGGNPLPWDVRRRLVLSRARETGLPSLMQATHEHPVVPYQKGPHVLHMLEAEIGREALARVFRLHFARTKHGYADVAGFLGIVNELTGGDFTWFFEQWLERSTGPRLSFDSISVARRDSGFVVTGVISQSRPTYRLQLPVEVRLADGRTSTRTVQVEGESTRFRFEYRARPLELVLDPGGDVFRWSDPAELPLSFDEAWTNLERDSAVSIQAHGSWVAPAVRSAFEDLLRETVPGIRIVAREAEAPYSLIVLGAPSSSPGGEACGEEAAWTPDRWAWVRSMDGNPGRFIMGIGGDPDVWGLTNGSVPEPLPRNDNMSVRHVGETRTGSVPALPRTCVRLLAR